MCHALWRFGQLFLDLGHVQSDKLFAVNIDPASCKEKETLSLSGDESRSLTSLELILQMDIYSFWPALVLPRWTMLQLPTLLSGCFFISESWS